MKYTWDTTWIMVLTAILCFFLIQTSCTKVEENVISCPETIKDLRDNQFYRTVLIGDQCWMAENLNIGNMILGDQDQTNNQIFEKYCYDDNTLNCGTLGVQYLGGLYQWDEMMQYDPRRDTIDKILYQGICPTGWHLPSDNEWNTLMDYLGGRDVAGGKMKDPEGFNGLLGGYRGIDSKYYDNNDKEDLWGFFWSVTEYTSDTTFVWYRYLYNNYNDLGQNRYRKGYGFSVRCIKDKE